MRDIYQDYTWQEKVEKWQKTASQQNKPFTAEQNNLNGIYMCQVINKYKDYDNQVLSQFSSERVADEGGDCCEPEEDEINFFHDEADEEEQRDGNKYPKSEMPFPTGASPKTGGASSHPGGAPSPKHYRTKRFTGTDSPSGDPKDHQCDPGMTELGGWIICKHCGANLKKI